VYSPFKPPKPLPRVIELPRGPVSREIANGDYVDPFSKIAIDAQNELSRLADARGNVQQFLRDLMASARIIVK
jgi:hypothetical protein